MGSILSEYRPLPFSDPDPSLSPWAPYTVLSAPSHVL